MGQVCSSTCQSSQKSILLMKSDKKIQSQQDSQKAPQILKPRISLKIPTARPETLEDLMDVSDDRSPKKILSEFFLPNREHLSPEQKKELFKKALEKSKQDVVQYLKKTKANEKQQFLSKEERKLIPSDRQGRLKDYQQRKKSFQNPSTCSPVKKQIVVKHEMSPLRLDERRRKSENVPNKIRQPRRSCDEGGFTLALFAKEDFNGSARSISINQNNKLDIQLSLRSELKSSKKIKGILKQSSRKSSFCSENSFQSSGKRKVRFKLQKC